MEAALKKRPYMPEPIKRAALFRNMQKHAGRLVCEETGEELSEADILSRRLHIDHVPPLALRYQRPDGTYEPDCNNLDFLEVVSAVGHIVRTAKRRGLYRGDQTEIARTRHIRLSGAEHRKRMREKAGLDWHANGEPKPEKKPSRLKQQYEWKKRILAERSK